MSRASWKGFFVSKSIKKNPDTVTIWSRRSSIPSFLLNKKVFIHNGKSFKATQITEEKIGLKFGEFSFTRKKLNKSAFLKNKKLPVKKIKK